jgi:hypothetical protein
LADTALPHDIERGIAALERRLGGEGALRRVRSRGQELASFDFVLPPDFLGVKRTARIGFLRGFPQSRLVVHIEPAAFLDWPHVMAKSVCLFGPRDEPAGGEPEEAVLKTVDQLGELVHLAMPTVSQKDRDAEFAREIRSYWGQQFTHLSDVQLVLAELPEAAVPLYALTDAELRKGIPIVLLGPSSQALRMATARFALRNSQVKAPAAAGFFLPLESLPAVRLPEPDCLVEWLGTACSASDLGALRTWLDTEAQSFRFLILRLPHAGGVPVFQPLVLRASGLSESAPVHFGRRAGRRGRAAPKPGPPARFEFVRLHVIAPEVVHSRAMEGSDRLRGAHVVMVGVGSLGGAMAANLARAGVGRLTLVDPEELEADNLGRHPLGTRQLGQKKADALAQRLNEDVPTVRVASISSHIQWGGTKAGEALAHADLVLVSSADWRSELWLWERKRSGAAWALLQVWSEPHAVAGHALVSPPGYPDDPQALFDANGEFRHCYSTDWPNGGVVFQPACGDSFIPGGPVALAAIATMGAQAAIDVLTGAVAAPRWYALSRGAGPVEAGGGAYCGPALADGVVSETRVRSWPMPPDSGP